MTQRIVVLAGYLFRSLLFSLAGLLFLLLALAFYLVLFAPGQRTPDPDYYILVIGVFGITLAFLVTLSISSRANQAVHFPIVVRLPSRPEYLTAVLIAALAFTLLVQAAVALVALVAAKPELELLHFLQIPPIWIAGQILFIVLALHASDLVTSGWSRVYIFGFVGFLLYFPRLIDPLSGWLADLLRSVANGLMGQDWLSLSDPFFRASGWLAGEGPDVLERLLAAPFWPFKAVGSAILTGTFSWTEALAPAIIMLYATFLFLMAADLFASKDLFLTE